MPVNGLFDWQWSLPLPSVFQRLGKSSTEFVSMYCDQNNKKASLHSPTLNAIMDYIDLEYDHENHTRKLGAIGLQNDIYSVVERKSTDATDAVFYNSNTGMFCAGTFKDSESEPDRYVMGKNNESGSILITALLPFALKDTEFQRYYTQLADCCMGGYLPTQQLSEAAYILCDNLYRRIGNAEQLGEAGLRVCIPVSGQIPNFTSLNLRTGYYSPTEVLLGEFTVLKANVTKAIVDVTKEGFQNKYGNGRLYDSREKSMIPKLKDSYIIPQEVISICEHISKTAQTSRPVRNILLRGEAGVGKTSIAAAIACGLGRPMAAPITCHSDMEAGDFLIQAVPVSAIQANYELPTFMDIQIDPPTAYQMLTGAYLEDVTEEEVYQKLIACIRHQVSSENSQHGPQYRYQESTLMEAMRMGYLIEIQEPSVIQKQGVLVGLNSLLDDCEEIVLATGEVISRHPDTVVIFTTNNDYEGCRNINQSVISRMDLVIDLDDLTKEQYIERAISNTGCQDNEMVTRMADVFMEIRTRLRENLITDGSCGQREFTAWVNSYMVTGNVLESSKYTVLSSLSSDLENRKDILDTCILTHFN